MPVASPSADVNSPLFDDRAFERTLLSGKDPIPLFRKVLKSAHTRLQERFQCGVPAHALVRQRATLIDQILVQAWHRFELTGDERLALVAVGGYGRGELHPSSDIDLLILLPESTADVASKALQEFITFLWDIGLEVGHSVRTLQDCVTEAERDVTVATNLMEARLIIGCASLTQRMRELTGPGRIWSSRRFFEAKRQEQIRRHHRFNDTAYNLEPNVKAGPGGLRDIQMIGWVAKRHFGAETLHELVTHEFLTESEYQALVEGQNFLWAVRFGLHIASGRREDRLLFDYQRSLAQLFGYRDKVHRLAVEQFMKQYYRNIMELSRLNEMLLELFQEVILHAESPAQIISVNKRFQAHNGFIEAKNNEVFKHFPFALLEIFLLLQQHPELNGVRASTIRLIRDHRYLIDENFRNDIRNRSLFLEIMRQPRGITHELRRMHRYGILAAYVPVFGAIVGQMQYDLFHVYTVDEHSLTVVRNLRSFAVPERYHEFPLCSAILQRVAKPEVLYLAGLFHDIAKGRGGDHSDLGAHEALRFCLHQGMSQYDARFVAWLVKHHLLMSTTAQRQDISDPGVVTNFASQVGDRAHLEYLYLLTVADIRATNPNLWNDWKDSLLRDLYEVTLRAFRRGLEHRIDRTELIQETQNDARHRLDTGVLEHVEDLWRHLGDDYFLRSTSDEIAWHTRAIIASSDDDYPLVLVRKCTGPTEIFVYTSDQDNLFAASTAILDRLGLTILDARIITADNGMTLNSYVVLEATGESITAGNREREIRDALHDQLRKPSDAIYPVNRTPRRQLKHFPMPTHIYFQTNESGNRTIMEVSTSDRPGLLSRIGWALAKCGVRLHNAKIATFGERAEDVFYVTDRRNQALSPGMCKHLKTRINQALATVENGLGQNDLSSTR